MGQHRKLGRNTTQRMAMLRNMASLLKYGKIETTEPKAKEVRKLTENDYFRQAGRFTRL